MPVPHADIPPPPQRKPLPWAVRWLLVVCALASLGTGIIGIFVPGLPTTVFVLMSGWAAARSSPRLHHWLWYHRLFGPMLRNWAEGGRVSRRAKWSATVMMALCAVVLVLSSAPRWVALGATACMACVLLWLWRRPEPG